jgi:hypothetical protein
MNRPWAALNLTLSPQAGRDSNGASVDLGYHYDPIDYAVSLFVTNGTVSVSNGIVLGGCGAEYGVWLFNNAVFTCLGEATNLNHMVRYNTVQEQSNTNWASTDWAGSFLNTRAIGSSPSTANIRFVEWSALGGDRHLDSDSSGASMLTFQDCQFYNGEFTGIGSAVAATNCLFQRVNTFLSDLNATNAVSNFFCNNLFWQGELLYGHDSGGLWVFRDNLFDQAALTNIGGANIDICLSNAYVTTNFGVLSSASPAVILTNSPAYEPGPLGQYYYPANLTNLITNGSWCATNVGLYHYTVTTNNVIDSNNPVSIGFHYVACGTNNLPLDSNGDGVPDCLEDANGDGIVDNGETNWALAILSQPASQTACQGSDATFIVGPDGLGPITYQWLCNGTSIPWGTSGSCTITNVQPANVGSYVMVASDSFGSVTSAVANLSISMTNTSYITDGLVAYWKLNDGSGTNAADSCGTNTLPLLNTPSWETNDCGAFYLALNGANQYGDGGPNMLTNLDTNDLTICAWINQTGTNYQGIVDKSYYYANNDYAGWRFFDETDQLKLAIMPNNILDTGPGAVPNGQWTFVAVAWHQSNLTADFYINGLLNSHGTANAGETPGTTANLELGNIQNDYYNTNCCFIGSMRDVGIYNRALSAPQVESNYLSTLLNTNVPYPNLLYYKMTEYPADYRFTLADSSTLSNTPGYVLGTNWVWTSNVASLPDKAMHFHGDANENNYIDTSNSVLFNFTTNSFTINLWFRPYQSGAFVMGNDTYSTCGWYLRLVESNSAVQFGAETNGQDYSIQTINSVSSWPAGPDPAGINWNMLTVTRDGTNTPAILINGQVWATTNTFANPAPSTNSLTIGSGEDDGFSNPYLDGDIWMVQMWDEALPATSVYILYTNQLSGVPWP